MRVPRVKLGRNAAVRPGGGVHVPKADKRARNKRRREIEDEQNGPEGS